MTHAEGPAGLEALDAAANRLSQVSQRHATDPFGRIPFAEALDRSRPAFPHALVSLYGHPVYEALPADQRWRLGLLEAVNFFSLNIHGEQALVATLVDRLYRQRSTGESHAVSRYLQHFIHEENSHTYMLAEYCQRYYGQVMPEIVFRFETPALSRKGADLLFFGRVYVLETFLDFVNRWAMRDDELDPTSQAVHRSHHLDETRHIAFDRAIIGVLTAELREAGLFSELHTIAAQLTKYADYAFSRLVNPRIYREMALPEPLRLLREVGLSAHRQDLKRQWWQHPSTFLGKVGLLPGAPAAGAP